MLTFARCYGARRIFVLPRYPMQTYVLHISKKSKSSRKTINGVVQNSYLSITVYTKFMEKDAESKKKCYNTFGKYVRYNVYSSSMMHLNERQTCLGYVFFIPVDICPYTLADRDVSTTNN